MQAHPTVDVRSRLRAARRELWLVGRSRCGAVTPPSAQTLSRQLSRNSRLRHPAPHLFVAAYARDSLPSSPDKVNERYPGRPMLVLVPLGTENRWLKRATEAH